MEQNNINPVGGSGQIPFINGQNANNQPNGQMQNGFNVNPLSIQNLPQEQQDINAFMAPIIGNNFFSQASPHVNGNSGSRFLNNMSMTSNPVDNRQNLESEYRIQYINIKSTSNDIFSIISSYFSVKRIKDLLSEEELKENIVASRLKSGPEVFKDLSIFKKNYRFFERFQSAENESYEKIYHELINTVRDELTRPLEEVFTFILELYSDYINHLSKKELCIDFDKMKMNRDDFELELMDQSVKEYENLYQDYKNRASKDSKRLKELACNIKELIQIIANVDTPSLKSWFIKQLSLALKEKLEGVIDPKDFTHTAFTEILKKKDVILKKLNLQLVLYNRFKEAEHAPDRLRDVLNAFPNGKAEINVVQPLLEKIANNPKPLFTTKQILLLYSITERQHKYLQNTTRGNRDGWYIRHYMPERSKEWRIRLLAKLIKNSVGSVDESCRKILLKYYIYIKTNGEQYYKNLNLKQFEETLNKEANLKGENRIKFTLKEKTTCLKALNLQNGNIPLDQYQLKHLKRFFPYVAYLPEIDFHKGAFADLSDQEVFELVQLAQNTPNILFINYPCESLPKLPFVETATIVDSKKLKRIQELKNLSCLKIRNTTIEEIDLKTINLKSLSLYDNLNLLSAKIYAPNIEKICTINNPELFKFELFNNHKSLTNLVVSGAPNLSAEQLGVVKFDRRFDRNFDHLQVNFTGSKLLMNDPSTRFMYGVKQTEGHFLIETEVLKNNPELVLGELQRYMYTYSLNTETFPKIVFLENGKAISPPDSGGPRRQFMMMLFSALKNYKEDILGEIRFDDWGDGFLPVAQGWEEDEELILDHCSYQASVIAKLLHLAFSSDAPIGKTFSLRFYECIKGIYFKKYSPKGERLGTEFYFDDEKAFLTYYPLLRKDLKDLCLIAEGKIDLASEELENKKRDRLLFSLGFFIADDKEVYSQSGFDFGFDFENVDTDKVLEIYKDNTKELKQFLFKSLLNQAQKEGNTKTLKTISIIVEKFYESLSLVQEKNLKDLTALQLKSRIEGEFSKDLLLASLEWNQQIMRNTNPEIQNAVVVADQQFRAWMQEANPETLSVLCAAVTGSTSLIEGSKIILTLQKKGRIPGSNTCVKTLFLPWDDAMDQEAFNKKMDQFIGISKVEMGL